MQELRSYTWRECRRSTQLIVTAGYTDLNGHAVFRKEAMYDDHQIELPTVYVWYSRPKKGWVFTQGGIRDTEDAIIAWADLNRNSEFFPTVLHVPYWQSKANKMVKPHWPICHCLLLSLLLMLVASLLLYYIVCTCC